MSWFCSQRVLRYCLGVLKTFFFFQEEEIDPELRWFARATSLESVGLSKPSRGHHCAVSDIHYFLQQENFRTTTWCFVGAQTPFGRASSPQEAVTLGKVDTCSAPSPEDCDGEEHRALFQGQFRELSGACTWAQGAVGRTQASPWNYRRPPALPPREAGMRRISFQQGPGRLSGELPGQALLQRPN